MSQVAQELTDSDVLDKEVITELKEVLKQKFKEERPRTYRPDEVILTIVDLGLDQLPSLRDWWSRRIQQGHFELGLMHELHSTIGQHNGQIEDGIQWPYVVTVERAQDDTPSLVVFMCRPGVHGAFINRMLRRIDKIAASHEVDVPFEVELTHPEYLRRYDSDYVRAIYYADIIETLRRNGFICDDITPEGAWPKTVQMKRRTV